MMQANKRSLLTLFKYYAPCSLDPWLCGCRYSVDPGDLDVAIGCVFRALPNTVERDEINVERLDQLNGALQLEDNEELVSHIIHVFPSNPDADIQVRVPH